MAASTKTPCACSLFDAIPAVLTEEQIETGDFQTITTGCAAVTAKTFAPGHDAKLKGFLIRHADMDIRFIEGGAAVSQDAVTHAARYGFAHMVARGIAKANGTPVVDVPNAPGFAATFAAAPVADDRIGTFVEVNHTPAPEAPVLSPVFKAKVGRWTYEGVKDGPWFVYTDAKGAEQKTLKWVRV